MKNKVIFISGTPGVGKTTIANTISDNLSKKFNVKLIKINDLAIKNDLIDGVDVEKGYKIVNIAKLDNILNNTIKSFFSNEKNSNPKIVIVEGHLSHLCTGCDVDKVIVLRLDPNLLEKRLKSREYNYFKVHENLESEALAVCSIEAYENYGDKVNEINTSNLAIEEVLTIIKEVVFDNKLFPIGNVDFIKWIID